MRANEFVTEIGVGALWKAAKANADSVQDLKRIGVDIKALKNKDDIKKAIAKHSSNMVMGQGAQQAWDKMSTELQRRRISPDTNRLKFFTQRYLDMDPNDYTPEERANYDELIGSIESSDKGTQEELDAWVDLASFATAQNALQSIATSKVQYTDPEDERLARLIQRLDRDKAEQRAEISDLSAKIATAEKEKMELQRQLDQSQSQELQQTPPQNRSAVQNQQDQVDQSIETVKAGTTVNMKPFGKVKWNGTQWVDNRNIALPDGVQKLATAEVGLQKAKKAAEDAKIKATAYKNVFSKARDELNANQ